MIWRGYGAAVIGIVFGSALIANLLANAIGGPRYWDTHGWLMAISFCADAFILLAMDFGLARRRPRTLIDEDTGERFVTQEQHELLFLRLRWWALIFVALALWVFLSGWSPGYHS